MMKDELEGAGAASGQVEALHGAKILIIDDEEPNVLLLERILKRARFENFVSTTDSREAAALFQKHEPDLVLLDLHMPHVDGFGVIAQLGELIGSGDYLPVVVLTADVTQQTKQRALSAGATDFLTKPFEHLEVLLRIGNLLRARFLHLKIQEQNATLHENVRQRTIELENALVDLKSAQQQVVQRERLAALGTMAGGIAHDFNNALGIIVGFTELLLTDAKQGLTEEKATPSLTTILTAAEDAAQIVHRLREFYRTDEAEQVRTTVNLNKLIEQAAALTKPRWQTQAIADGREIRVRADFGEIPAISGDAAELREALTNLIFNAVDAMPRGGVITLQTRAEGGTVLMRLSDTGTGMSEEVRRRCLEPFFTTKGERGTGLGLAMVFGIIHRHAGAIDIESEPGKGTTFTLSLPAIQVESEAAITATEVLERSLHILVVDDQPILCQLMCEYLQNDLHTVETALDGVEAIEKFRSGKFDLVITDHIMAQMNGKQLATAIKQLHRNVPLILLTGYADQTDLGTNIFGRSIWSSPSPSPARSFAAPFRM